MEGGVVRLFIFYLFFFSRDHFQRCALSFVYYVLKVCLSSHVLSNITLSLLSGSAAAVILCRYGPPFSVVCKYVYNVNKLTVMETAFHLWPS